MVDRTNIHMRNDNHYDDIDPVRITDDKLNNGSDNLTVRLDHSGILRSPIDTNDIPMNVRSAYSPLSIYIIICFLCVMTIIIYRSSVYSIPSILTMTSFLFIMLVSCAILSILANISIAAEWACLIIVTFVLLLTTYAILVPTVFFYPKLS
jgi:hypothetical protein